MGIFFKKKKKGKLEFCTNNLNQFYDDESFVKLDHFITEHGLEVKEMDCLSYCDECTCSPYALVDATYVEADTPEQLIQKLKEMDFT